jgi:hypothetical protein
MSPIKIRLVGEFIFASGKLVPVFWNFDESLVIGAAVMSVEPNGVNAEIHLEDIFPAEVMLQAEEPEYWSAITDKGIFCCGGDYTCGSSNFVTGLSLSREVIET